MNGGKMRKRRSTAPETGKTKTKPHVTIEKTDTMMVEIPLWLIGEVNDDSVKELIAQIDQINSSVKPENLKNTYITLNISSEGGDVYSGFALIDSIKNSQVIVHTHIASVVPVKSLSKTEIEFLDSLKKIGISKSLCESVNGIRRAVFENDTVGTHGVLMSDEDIAEQYSGWWIGSIKMYKDGDVGLEFYYPNADDIDYDSYTYMIIGKHHDGRYYDKNDNWTPESEFKRIVDVVKLAKNVLKPEEDIVFNNKEEFDNWVEENSRKVGDVFESMEDTDYENPLSMYGVPMSERENIKKQTDAFSSWMCETRKR